MTDHVHVWRFKRTDENWFDGDETDVYECENCNELDYRYVPR